MERKSIQYRQLCAIATSILAADYHQTDADWKEAIKTYLAKGGWTLMDLQMLTRACDAVERSLQHTCGPRPLPDSTPAPVASIADAAPLTRTEAKTIMRQLQAGTAMKQMPAASVPTLREAEKRKAWQIQLQAIADQVARVKAAEDGAL